MRPHQIASRLLSCVTCVLFVRWRLDRKLLGRINIFAIALNLTRSNLIVERAARSTFFYFLIYSYTV